MNKVDASSSSLLAYVDASSSLASDGEAVCYLCLDAGPDESGLPLQRDCSCRGTDAGFVHLSCLAEYAASKSKQACDMDEFCIPWIVCCSCNQTYQNQFRIDIASEFVSFVRQQYPGNTSMQVESLDAKLIALRSMFGRLQPVQKSELRVTANVILSLIDRMKGDTPPLPTYFFHFEAEAHDALGRIDAEEGTKESARRAVAHLEKALELHEANGNNSGAAIIKNNLVVARSMYEVVNREELVKASYDAYKLRVDQYGEEDGDTIHAGKIHAFHLLKANRNAEARELLTKLLTTSKQVLGSHHSTTMDVASQLQFVSMQLEGEYAIELLQDYRGAEATELLTKVLATSKQVLGPNFAKEETVFALEKAITDWTERQC
jgi:hypothetical protein